MAEPISLFNRLKLNSMYNIGIYISGIILIFSFIITPEQINLPLLRAVCLKILLLSFLTIIIPIHFVSLLTLFSFTFIANVGDVCYDDEHNNNDDYGSSTINEYKCI